MDSSIPTVIHEIPSYSIIRESSSDPKRKKMNSSPNPTIDSEFSAAETGSLSAPTLLNEFVSSCSQNTRLCARGEDLVVEALGSLALVMRRMKG